MLDYIGLERYGPRPLPDQIVNISYPHQIHYMQIVVEGHENAFWDDKTLPIEIRMMVRAHNKVLILHGVLHGEIASRGQRRESTLAAWQPNPQRF